MRRFCRDISYLMMSLIMSVAVASCSLIDFDFDDSLHDGCTMRMTRDSVFVMLGDTFTLSVDYYPQSNGVNAVMWSLSSDTVVSVKDNVFTAVGPGGVYVTAQSVTHGLTDSCYVSVMEWEASPYTYPSEMIFYARVTINGEPFDPSTMRIAAFVNGECRGVGESRSFSGIDYVFFRIWGNNILSGNKREIVRFRVYKSDELLCDYIPLGYYFDGETHGSLSDLVELNY